MRLLVAAAAVGRLATVATNGRPHVVPICFSLVGDTVYSAVDDKPKSTTRLRRLQNLRDTGLASLLVDHYEADWSRLWWVRLDAVGRVLPEGTERERAVATLAGKYDQYAAQPPAGPVLALDVTGWQGWSAGG
jgi:PPOX class probable F420-dependent enzyme